MTTRMKLENALLYLALAAALFYGAVYVVPQIGEVVGEELERQVLSAGERGKR